MIAVPPWALSAVVLLAGCAIVATGPTRENKKANETDLTENGITALGLLICIFGLWVLWIGPNPEPPSAWVAIAIGGVSGSAIITKSASPAGWTTGSAMLGTSLLMAATLILRASLPGFE